MQAKTPIIIHFPHSGTLIPSNEWQYFTTDNLKDEIIKLTDHYCDDLFSCMHEMISFPVSRLVCDAERFRDDEKESMSKKGMGAVYIKGHKQDIIKEISKDDKERVIREYYDTHHERLNAAVRKRLDTFGKCLIIDGHSFYESPLPYEYNQRKNRPDICIGTDEYHTPDWLTKYMVKAFKERGYTVTLNSPFAGTMVPGDYFRTDKRVSSIMIEINRRLYIDERANKTFGYIQVKEDVRNIIEGIK